MDIAKGAGCLLVNVSPDQKERGSSVTEVGREGSQAEHAQSHMTSCDAGPLACSLVGPDKLVSFDLAFGFHAGSLF